ncbi:MAG: hypothetical protein KAH21_13435 [Spirochaetaceae bacterium]|nr:hypothetical protein [Spirochaetaceae bacterium]
MTLREDVQAILHYEEYQAMPVVHFGFWKETLEKWADEGHISKNEAESWSDCSDADVSIGGKLGFDFNWGQTFTPDYQLHPSFSRTILEEHEDGTIKLLNEDGVIVMEKRGVTTIPTEVDHYFKGRKEWNEQYKNKLIYSEDRFLNTLVPAHNRMLSLNKGGMEYLSKTDSRKTPLGFYGGSLIGFIRNFVGVENLSYLTVDDPDLLLEMVDTVGNLCFSIVESVLKTGAHFDYLHFWEDICYKNGPLVTPLFFKDSIGPHYRRITDLASSYGIDIVSVDCDGMIDHLLPIWLDNGVNTMFPIEVGTWNASILPWREQYGRDLRGVGGMNKTIFSLDYKAVEREVERLKPLVASGGYIPCPDHRIAPDAKWENVQHYCELMRKNF